LSRFTALCLAALLLLGGVLPLRADEAAPCKVLDPELQGAYQGGCRGGLAHGKAMAGGFAQYEGEFRKGRKHGSGVKTWPWGDRYEGEFWKDMKHGHGVYVWGPGGQWAGQRYEGQFVKDQRHGYGVYTWPDGDRYAGEWVTDQRLGPGGMEKRRELARIAQTEAFKPGVTVCWASVASQTMVGPVKGIVDAFDGAVLKVKLVEVPPALLPFDGAALKVGQIVADDPVDWAPCV
jgi:hypothetical protein